MKPEKPETKKKKGMGLKLKIDAEKIPDKDVGM